MSNNYFSFKQFTIEQDRCAMKVSTDACLFGAYIASYLEKRNNMLKRVLDIGTGTGLLSLMLAQKNPLVYFTAIELDEMAASQANENFLKSPWSSRFNLKTMDVLQWHQNNDSKFDLIICNPPFFKHHLPSDQQQRSMARHDDFLSLDLLLQIADKHLEEQGLIAILLPYVRKEECIDLLSKKLHLVQLVETADNAQKPFNRFICCFSKSKDPIDFNTEKFVLHEDNGQRSATWQALIQDYYLR